MKIDNRLTAERAAMVARDRAIVMRERARTARTTDGIRTTDPAPSKFAWKGRGRFRDTVLSAETTQRNPNMLGSIVWNGDVKAQLDRIFDRMSVGDRKKALDHYANKMNEGSGTMREGNAGSLATVGDEPFIGSGADPQDVNDANRRYWDSANKHVTRDTAPPRDATQAAIQTMQRANDEYYAKQTAWQRRPEREWGKG
jgi:hypothetical protein